MTETANLSLPLVQPSQAQKHVTVNEALTKLDGLAQLALHSVTLATPPAVTDGACYGVPVGATDAWLGLDGQIAIGSNGGWVFAVPQAGWRAWVIDTAQDVQWSGTDWAPHALGQSPFGAGATFRTVEDDVDLTAGGAQDVALAIPAQAMVFAVSTRVVTEITGDLVDWRFGTASSDNQFGAGMGRALGSFSSGILGTPTTFYSATPLRFTPQGGDVAAGRLRIAMNILEFSAPGL